MKIWAISDTHSNHNLLQIPEGIDTVIHAGDSTNYRDLFRNEIEFRLFIEWYKDLQIKNKVLIAGNHDAWATKNYNLDLVKNYGIHYVEHDYLDIEGIKLFGSPYTPTFGDWYFMKNRFKLYQYWEILDQRAFIDILITHGPPKGILDSTVSHDNYIEQCGDRSLLNKVLEIKPKYHIFGHIHNYQDCINQGTRVYKDITFMNVSCVNDGQMGKLSSNGIIFEI